MNSIDATDFLNNLLRQDVETVQEWLQSIVEKKAKPPDNFNWLGFDDVSAFRARELVLESKEISLQWGQIAIAAYEILNEIDTNVRALDSSHTYYAMWLRAYLIHHLGVQDARIFNPQMIFEWFFSSLEISHLEARARSQKWKSFLSQKQKRQLKHSEIEEMLQLRRIKGKLKVIEFLLESHPQPIDKDLSLWLSIKDDLL